MWETTEQAKHDGSGPAWERVKHESGWIATVRFDGCIHLERDLSPNGPRDYLHICDLPEFIKMLQGLEEVESRVVV